MPMDEENDWREAGWYEEQEEPERNKSCDMSNKIATGQRGQGLGAMGLASIEGGTNYNEYRLTKDRVRKLLGVGLDVAHKE